jgi:hypothetical protein
MKNFVPPVSVDLFGNNTVLVTDDKVKDVKVSKTKVTLQPICLKKHLIPYVYRWGVGEGVANGPDTFVFRVNNKTAFGRYLYSIPLFIKSLNNALEIKNKKVQIEYNRRTKEILFLHYSFTNRYEIMVDEKINMDLNLYIEDFFRTEFIALINAKLEIDHNLCKAIREFSEMKDLENCGFDNESLRIYYYKEINRMKTVLGQKPTTYKQFDEYYPKEKTIFDLLKSKLNCIII